MMLTDRYELPLSTASSAARDAYIEGCEAKLTMYPGAIEAFDRAIAADPRFALAHNWTLFWLWSFRDRVANSLGVRPPRLVCGRVWL